VLVQVLPDLGCRVWHVLNVGRLHAQQRAVNPDGLLSADSPGDGQPESAGRDPLAILRVIQLAGVVQLRRGRRITLTEHRELVAVSWLCRAVDPWGNPRHALIIGKPAPGKGPLPLSGLFSEVRGR
jgi:hypothetical protein